MAAAASKWQRSRRVRTARTPLQRLLDERSLTSAQIEAKLRERLGENAPDPRVVMRWRLGLAEPRRKSMVHLLWAVRECANDPTITIQQIIDLDPDNSANWRR